MKTEQAKRPAKKKRKKRSPKQVATGLAIAQRREKATKLKLAGWSVRDIAAHLKVSVGTAQSDITAAYAEAEDNAAGYVKRERAISLERLDVATKGIWPSVENGDLEAVDRLVKIEARRAKAIGFDAPTKVDASVTTVALDEIDELRKSAEANSCSSEDPPKLTEPNG